MNIVDTTGKEISQGAVLSQVFRLPGQTVSGFHAEVKALTPENKADLAEGAAKYMGYTVQKD